MNEKKVVSPYNRTWSKEEADFALNNYGPLSAREVGARIGRSEASVRQFIKRYDESRGAR